jgi:hypothetical protein
MPAFHSGIDSNRFVQFKLVVLVVFLLVMLGEMADFARGAAPSSVGSLMPRAAHLEAIQSVGLNVFLSPSSSTAPSKTMAVIL